MMKAIEKDEYGPLGAAARSERGPDESRTVKVCDVCETPVPADIGRFLWLNIPESVFGPAQVVCPACQLPGQRKKAIGRIAGSLKIQYGAQADYVGQKRRMLDELFSEIESSLPDDTPKAAFSEIKRLKGLLE